jgi:diadenosine tetraphosphatase ApaH/serine/threonine PP2A family protein phosphatase
VETLARTPAHADGLRLDLDECCAYLLNPGSVGQPRDNDPRAAYILFDPAERQVRYRRCAYDIEKSRERIHQAGLPAILGDRLAVGR